MVRMDRRKKRTRELLQKTLIELMGEREYDEITIQEIVDRADLGRTTFYQHYHNKDELFLSCHQDFVGKFYFGPHRPLSRKELLSPDTPPGMVEAYTHLEDTRALLYPTFQGRDGLQILRQIRDGSAKDIETDLRAVFAGVDSTIPLDLLACYLAGAQIALVQWFLEKRRSHTPKTIAQMFHRLQRAAILEAFRLQPDRNK